MWDKICVNMVIICKLMKPLRPCFLACNIRHLPFYMGLWSLQDYFTYVEPIVKQT